MNQLTGIIRASEIYSKIVNMEAEVQELKKAKELLWDSVKGHTTAYNLISKEYERAARELTLFKNQKYVEAPEEEGF